MTTVAPQQNTKDLQTRSARGVYTSLMRSQRYSSSQVMRHGLDRTCTIGIGGATLRTYSRYFGKPSSIEGGSAGVFCSAIPFIFGRRLVDTESRGKAGVNVLCPWVFAPKFVAWPNLHPIPQYILVFNADYTVHCADCTQSVRYHQNSRMVELR